MLERSFRVALAVMGCPLGDRSGNLGKVRRLVLEAVEGGARMVVFPELSVSGYALSESLVEGAEAVPGESSAALSAISREAGAAVLAGLAERAPGGGVYAAHLAAFPDGSLHVYRKLHVNPVESPYIKAGDLVPVFLWEGLCFGIQLCYDAHFPWLSARMAEAGADVIFMPHASPRGDAESKLASWARHLPARAFDNGVYVAAVNQSGDNRAGLDFPGAAVVYGPDGRALASSAGIGDGLLTVDLDPVVLAGVRGHRMRYFLPQSRPDLEGRQALRVQVGSGEGRG